MSGLISKEALIKELNELRRYVPVPSYKDVFDIIMKAKSIEQPQSVADALEEAANIKVNYTKSGRDDALTKIVEDVIQEAVESAISQYKEAIRALIKRNTEEGE